MYSADGTDGTDFHPKGVIFATAGDSRCLRWRKTKEQLPDSKRIKSQLLKMDDLQAELIQIITRNF